MTAPSVEAADVVVSLAGLDRLIAVLGQEGYEVHGPTVDNGVISHDLIVSVDELPVGLTDRQSGGTYRLEQRGDNARFGYAVGPRSWKQILHPPRTRVWTMSREEIAAAANPNSEARAGVRGVNVSINRPRSTPRAFLGVRPCELAAIGKQDRVLIQGPHPDPDYQANRHDNIIIAVNCGDPSDSCFCSAMGTGPAADSGYDLALTELVTGGRFPSDEPRYLAQVGSERGASILAAVSAGEPNTTRRQDWHIDLAEDGDRAQARQVIERAVAVMTERFPSRLDDHGVTELLYQNLDSDQWADIAQRCLSCGNCTLACPTCFCTNLEDVTDLSGEVTDRWRVWDTCFSLDFSHMGPGPVRADIASRYRQWLLHKLGSWHDQFGESGCVGCGRCITWCPVGIDLRDELSVMAGHGGAR
ncbi:MAG: 4Fe-4S dicluster domain-containing protein [Acidimicrobiia bacterium]|nr:4Fe-4S dicluster domain-containing protein [Acidimicrobiia bacterium]